MAFFGSFVFSSEFYLHRDCGCRRTGTAYLRGQICEDPITACHRPLYPGISRHHLPREYADRRFFLLPLFGSISSGGHSLPCGENCWPVAVRQRLVWICLLDCNGAG